ncbi:MAG: T9SS type A sorting domain-containing protein [Bacteroidota bacterium]
MKKLLLFFVTFYIYIQSTNATIYHVLYLGNSLTYVNDVPSLVNQIAISKGDTIIWDQNTPGGHQLAQHAANPTSLSKISAYKWDIVVIQAQSQQTAFPDGQLELEVYPPCKFLVDSIHRNNPCTRVMYYMPAGWKYGDNMNCAGFPDICTYEGQFARIRQTHLNMIDSTDASIIPSGVSYRVSRLQDSTLDLWSSDNVHPSMAGSYLTALNMYASFTKKATFGSSYIPTGLTAMNTEYLQNIADTVVFDSMSRWKLDRMPPVNSVVNFNSYYTWGDMGEYNRFRISHDSTTDSLFYIVNIMDLMGDTINNLIVGAPNDTTTFYVNLYDTLSCYFIGSISQVHIGACKNDTLTQNYNWACEGIAENNFINIFSLYPNPSSDKIMIEKKENLNKNYHIEIIDIRARKILESGFDNYTQLIDISALSKGMYYIVLKDELNTYISKFIKE